MSIDGLQGSTRPFDPRIHAARGMTGQEVSADNLRNLLEGSAINAAHANCGRVQDAYSMRCAPQVHGAARDAIQFALRTFLAEANAATDNPMVFAETSEIVSGGNFHGAPVALAADVLAIGLTHLATISERRSDRLVNPIKQWPAGIPHTSWRSAVRADDGSGDRCRTHLRAQDARASRRAWTRSRRPATKKTTSA